MTTSTLYIQTTMSSQTTNSYWQLDYTLFWIDDGDRLTYFIFYVLHVGPGSVNDPIQLPLFINLFGPVSAIDP